MPTGTRERHATPEYDHKNRIHRHRTYRRDDNGPDWSRRPARRDSAARTQCSNNLRQMSLGILNYLDANAGKLPPLTDQGAAAPTGHGLTSLFATLMPYLEGGVVSFQPNRTPPNEYYAPSSVIFKYQDKVGETVTETGGVANRGWRLFVDPGDTTANGLRDVPMTLPDGSAGYYATGSYAANGMVPWATGSVAKSFPNGTGHSILIGERPQLCRNAGGETVYNLWGLGFYSPNMPAFAMLTPDDPAGLISTGQAAPALPLPPRARADELRIRLGRENALPQLPDFATPLQTIRGAAPCDPRLPGSPHLGLMQTAMADGSVRSFATTVNPWVFWAACLTNGGEDLPADW